jgi:hypothetical protein
MTDGIIILCSIYRTLENAYCDNPLKSELLLRDQQVNNVKRGPKETMSRAIHLLKRPVILSRDSVALCRATDIGVNEAFGDNPGPKLMRAGYDTLSPTLRQKKTLLIAICSSDQAR